MTDRFNLDDYVTVNDRVQEFWRRYPEGRIETEIVHIDSEAATSRLVVVKASVFADRNVGNYQPISTGISKEREGVGYVNKTSFLENCETSAIGRALANLGFLIDKQRPSREEMASVARQEQEHKELLEQIKAFAKEGSPELKARIKSLWPSVKEDPVAAAKLVNELTPVLTVQE